MTVPNFYHIYKESTGDPVMKSHEGFCVLRVLNPLVQRQDMAEEELQMKTDIPRVGPEGGPVHPEVESAIQQARGGGQPLDGALQEQMGASLGHDFSEVRIHNGPGADELNRQLSARAFTFGSDIFFAQRAYNPDTRTGRELIAHELVHVVQHNNGCVSGEGTGMTIQPAGDLFEQEAEKLSLFVGDGRKAKTSDILQRRHPEGAVVQRALAGRVAPIFGAGAMTWNGIPTSCHFATIYWIILDEANRMPTANDFMNIGNINEAMKRMVQNGGVRINQPPGGGQLNLTTGSVIVFVRNNEPSHSCVATSATRVGGYNQLGWFTAGGSNHGYSSHNTNQFKAWGPRRWNRNKIRGNVANVYYRLYSVSEAWAKAIIWQML